LRRFLAERLPEYMTPAHFVKLDAWPLTPNGKLDRKALPALQSPAVASEVATTLSPVEEVLAGIWMHLLKINRVRAEDNFFELGGHSLLAIQTLSRIREAFRIELSLRSLFESPTLRSLAGRIEQQLADGDGLMAPPIGPVSRQDPLPLSFAQQRLWFLSQLNPDSNAYNIPLAVRFQGGLDFSALESVLGEIVRRHEILRTSIQSINGQPQQIIAPAKKFVLPLIDLRELEKQGREAESRRLAREEPARPFDLERGALVRAVLLELGVDESIALLTMHHIVSDGWSMGILMREVAALYEAYVQKTPSPLPELPIQYADYSHWQRQWLKGELLDRQLQYWKEHLGGELPILNLPTDRPRPLVQSFRGARKSMALDPKLSKALRELSRAEGVTMFMTLLAGFQALLYRYSGQRDIPVGTPISGRTQVETEPLIGFFINTLVMKTRIEGEICFRQLLERVRETALGAYTHQDLPFEKLVEELHPERGQGHTPFIQTWFVVHNISNSFSLPNLRLSHVPVEFVNIRFDLALSIVDAGEGLLSTLEYNADLFDASMADQILQHYVALLQEASSHPDRKLLEIPLESRSSNENVLAAPSAFIDYAADRFDF